MLENQRSRREPTTSPRDAVDDAWTRPKRRPINRHRRAPIPAGRTNASQADIRRLRSELARQRRATERAAAASDAKSAFLASMSHELRTPLHSVIGGTDLILTGLEDPLSDDQRGLLERVSSSAAQLLSLIDEILDLSRVEAGRMPFEPARVDIGEQVAEALATVGESAAGKGLDLQQVLSRELSTVEVDPKRLRQILLNYLSNAVKFTPKGGRVTIRASNAGQNFRIEVEDTGCGIPHDLQDRLFSDYYQATSAAARAQPGSGLGLALSKRLAEAQGGSVGMTSAPGQGSCFWVELPVSPRR